jgi:transcriptional regulator with XRE-family HTH domain
MASLSQRRELADFLRTRRSRLRPQDVDLPPGRRRRTEGLRREELALLAGISVTWYTRLEQARDIRVSTSVLESLARTLGLDASERAHLFLLAHGTPPAEPPEPATGAGPKLTRLLEVVMPSPAYVTDARSDVLGWNASAAALFTDFAAMPADRRNLVWWAFTDPAAREVLCNWDDEAQALLARFRTAAGRHADDPRFTGLVRDLLAVSPQAREWWARHDVRSSSSGTKTLCHPVVGTLTLDHTVLQSADAADVKVVVYTAPAGSPDEEALVKLSRLETP